MSADALLFWLLCLVTVFSAGAMLLFANPIYSALSLVMTMIGVAALFVTLGAYFLAGVQLIVYAGAVLVLFVMVLMLFDLKNEIYAFSAGQISGFLKLVVVGALAGILAGAVIWSGTSLLQSDVKPLGFEDNTKSLGELLFSQYIFGFEALGVLLLVVAIGAVALARSRGGTHART